MVKCPEPRLEIGSDGIGGHHRNFKRSEKTIWGRMISAPGNLATACTCTALDVFIEDWRWPIKIFHLSKM
jgi:hypothetical protein